MTKRRSHSSIDKLPKDLQQALMAMIVDNVWPDDFSGKHKGNPRYEDLVVYCSQKGFTISKSAVGRKAEEWKVFSLMKSSGLIARNAMAGLTDENASKTQKAASEMATALLLKLMVNEENNFTSKQLKEISQAIRDLTQVTIKADQYVRDQLEAKLKEADKNITTIIKTKKIDPEVLRLIREQVYGIKE